MLNCPECGKNIEENYLYCPSCGTKFKRDLNNEGNVTVHSKVRQSLWGEIAILRERLAEARFNEQLGWSFVGMALIIVITLPLIRTKIGVSSMLLSSSSFNASDYAIVNITTILFILAAILVILGATVSVNSRHQRMKLLKKLEINTNVE